MAIEELIWLFPILFMIHDFEEIILVNPWKKADFYSELKLKPYKDFISTESFSLAVFQEFVLFCIVCILSVLMGDYFLWFGMFAAIVFHFLVHLAISIRIKRYHPGVVTSLVLFLPGLWLLYRAAQVLDYSVTKVLLSSFIGLILLLVNLKVLHRLMPFFERIIRFSFEGQGSGRGTSSR